MYNWDDLRIFVAVARQGSALCASRALGMNQTTVARRIAALEADLGLSLFEKLQTGYRLTEAGHEILALAERIEAEALSLAALAQQQKRNLAGVVRVTLNEAIANQFLTPALGDFAERYPDIKVQLLIDDRRVDIAGGEADVAIRAGSRPTEGNLVIRKLATASWTFYCSEAYAARKGFPACAEELDQHVLLGGHGGLAALPPMTWMLEVAPNATIHSYSSSVTNHVVAIRAGLGVGPLPSLEGDRYADLIRCFAAPAQLASEVVLVTRSDLKDVPRIRAFNDFIVARFNAMRHSTEGKGVSPAEGSLLLSGSGPST